MSKIALAHVAAATAALSAGAAVVATRYVVGETDPAALALYRYIISILCFAPILLFIWPSHRLTASDYATIAMLGIVFFGLFPWAFNASLQYIPAARGAIGLATIPIQTLIVAALFGREPITRPKALGVTLAFLGIMIVYGPEAAAAASQGALRGDILMLLGALCAAVYSVFSRATLERHGALFVTALAMIFAVLALLPIVHLQTGLLPLPSFSAKGWIAVIFLGTCAGAIQFSLFTWALRWLPPTTTVLYLTLNPVSAMLLGHLLMNEQLTLALVVGLMLVLAGIFVGSGVLTAINPGRRKGHAPPERALKAPTGGAHREKTS